jgi:hypothetical protein
MKKNLVIFPEIISGVIRNNELDIFLIWQCSKLIPSSENGIIEVKELLNIAKRLFGYSDTYSYSKINKGIDKFWRKPFGLTRQKKVCLITIDKIISKYEINVTRCMPFEVPLSAIQYKTIKEIKNFFIGIVASRYDLSRPIAIHSIVENCGISESSVRNALQDCQYVKTKRNYQLISQSFSKVALGKELQSKQDPWAYRIISNESYFQLIRQLPNSYSMPEFNRLSMKMRPKSLRKIDKQLLDKIDQRKYFSIDNTNYHFNDKILTY